MGAVCSKYGDKTGVHRVMVWKVERKNHWEHIDIVWWIGLKCLFKKCGREIRAGFIWPRISKGGRLLRVW
jgi:hypothetical protein